jgi:hypothetical protein
VFIKNHIFSNITRNKGNGFNHDMASVNNGFI